MPSDAFSATTRPTSGRTSDIFDIFGPRIQFLTALTSNDDDFCLVVATFPPHVVIPLHSHSDRETIYILNGELEAWRDGRWSTLGAGDAFDLPSGVKHAFRNASGAGVSLLVVTTVRMGRFFWSIGRRTADVKTGPLTRRDAERLTERAHAYGYWVASPDDNAEVGLVLG